MCECGAMNSCKRAFVVSESPFWPQSTPEKHIQYLLSSIMSKMSSEDSDLVTTEAEVPASPLYDQVKCEKLSIMACHVSCPIVFPLLSRIPSNFIEI